MDLKNVAMLPSDKKFMLPLPFWFDAGKLPVNGEVKAHSRRDSARRADAAWLSRQKESPGPTNPTWVTFESPATGEITTASKR